MLIRLNELNSPNCYFKLILNLVTHMHSKSLSVLIGSVAKARHFLLEKHHVHPAHVTQSLTKHS